MKRLAWLVVVLAALALVLVAGGCGDDRGARIVLWHSYRGAERDALQAAAERWNARARAAGEPQLRLVAVPYEAMVDKISAAVPNGNGPDLFIFAHDRIGTWAEAGVIEPISYWVDEATADRYLPQALAALAYRERLYGLPLAVKCTALFYRKQLVPTPPSTTDELVTMGRALTKAGRYGLGYEAHKLYFHAGWLHGFGGQVLDQNGRVDIATPAAAAAADFGRLLAGPGGIVPAEPSPALLSSLFNDGKLGMVISGPWFVDEIAKGVDYGIAPLPVVSATGLPAAPYLGVEGVLVSARAHDKRAAYRIAAALADDASAIARARAARQIVPNLAAYRDPEVASDPVVSAFRSAAERARAMPSDPAMGSIWSAYDRALEKVVVLGERAPAALSAAHGEAERYARRTRAMKPPRAALLTTLVALACGLGLAGLGFVRARNAGAERQSRVIAVAEAEHLVAEIATAAHKGGAKAALARLEALRAALRASDRIDLLELLPSAGRPFLRRYALLATLQGGGSGSSALVPAPSPAGASPRKSAHDLAERARSLGHGVAQLIDPDAPSADDATPTTPDQPARAGQDGSGGPTVRAAALSGSYALVIERLPAVGPAALPGGTLLICSLLALAIALVAGLALSARRASLLGAIAAAAAIAWTARAGARAVGLPEAETARVLGAVGALAALAIGILAVRGSFARALAALRAHRVAYIYLLPAAATTLLLVGVPFAVGLALGFFDHANGRYDFVGIDNFVEILSGGGHPFGDPLNFWFTLGVTLLWTFVNVVLHVGMGLGLALLLSRPKLRMRGLYRVLLVLPWAVPNYITALIWRGMFQQHHGAVNSLLGALGLSKVAWFSSFSAAFSANVVTNTWLGFPFMMVVSMGALAAIPKELYEAAAVDGASRWTSFSRITMPLLGPALMPAVILGSIWTFNMFNVIYLVSEGRPGGATDILVTEAYRWAFERGDRYGLAAAYATLIFIVLAVYTLLANRGARRREAMLERS